MLTPEEKVKVYQHAQNLVDQAKYVLTNIDNARADTLNDMVNAIQGDIDLVIDEEYYAKNKHFRESVYAGYLGQGQ